LILNPLSSTLFLTSEEEIEENEKLSLICFRELKKYLRLTRLLLSFKQAEAEKVSIDLHVHIQIYVYLHI
jgi:hypothetical protein